ncbi:myosin-6-like [Culex quinquefasciatus]|uniref:myosin-6-like n=1 Tax=Culex quinquefasciatus TaxID=7176 RepID=UPI0018E2EDE3|nr:myosin-6-like [Culex quinquefasciatus]
MSSPQSGDDDDDNVEDSGDGEQKRAELSKWLDEALEQLQVENELLDECNAQKFELQRQIVKLKAALKGKVSLDEDDTGSSSEVQHRAQNQLDAVIRENVALRAQLLESQQRINEFEQTISNASASLEAAGSIPCDQCISLERLLEEARTQLDQRVAQLSTAAYEKHQLREQIAGIEASHRARTSGLEDAVKFDMRQLKVLQRTVTDKQKEIAMLRGQVAATEELNKELKGCIAEKTELERTVIRQSAVLQDKEDSIKRLEGELRARVRRSVDAGQMTEAELDESEEESQQNARAFLDTRRESGFVTAIFGLSGVDLV